MHDMNKNYTTQARLPDGANCYLGALTGWRLMELLRDYGVPIKAECGGACACATSHIYIHKEGRTGLLAPDDKELMRLDELFDTDHDSRMSYQILTDRRLTGLLLASRLVLFSIAH